MPEIKHQTFYQHLKESEKLSFAPVYLIYGEEFLYQELIHHIVNAIIPDSTKQRHNYEIIQHQTVDQIVDVVERLNTYSFFSEKKIIELKNSGEIYSMPE